MAGPLSFSKGSLREIGEYLSLVVEEPRSMGKVFHPFNSTFIANIPKNNSPLNLTSPSHYEDMFTKLCQSHIA
jgi:hypothetical protein